MAHCWENGPLADDGCSQTCMLQDGHQGAHEWTRDDCITVSFTTELPAASPPVGAAASSPPRG